MIGGEGKTLGMIDCALNPSLCRGALEDAADGKTPNLPDAPAEEDGGDKPDDEEPTTESGPSSMQVIKEYRSYSKQHKGRMYFRSKSGKRSVVKDWITMHKKIIMREKRR